MLLSCKGFVLLVVLNDFVGFNIYLFIYYFILFYIGSIVDEEEVVTLNGISVVIWCAVLNVVTEL